MADADADVSAAVLEWAVGAIARQLDAMWIHGPGAEAIEEVLRSSGKKRPKPAELEALRVTGMPPPGSSQLHHEYAALFEPLRQARAIALTACSGLGDTVPALGSIDPARGRRLSASRVSAVLPLDTPTLAGGLHACEACIVAGTGLTPALTAHLDDLDYPPARVAQRAFTLQLAGISADAVAASAEREYAAAFEPARSFRQLVRTSLQAAAPAAPATALAVGGAGAASSGTAAGAACEIVAAIRELRTELDPPAVLSVLSLTKRTRLADSAAVSVAVRSLIAALVSHQHIAAVVERAFRLLLSMLREFPGAHAAAHRAAVPGLKTHARLCVAADGICAVLSALTTHVGSETLSAIGCGILGHISSDAAHCGAIASAGGVGVVVGALRAHCGSVAVVEEACYVLQALAQSAGGARSVAEAVPPALNAMRMHVSSKDVFASTCYFLSLVGPEHGMEVASADDCAALVAGIARHGGSEDVVSSACSVLHAVVHYRMYRGDSVVSADCVPVLVATLRTHSSCLDVADFACGVLHALANHAGVHDAFVAAGGLATIVTTLRRHRGDPTAAARACWLLHHNCVSAAHCADVLAAGGCSAIVDALKRHAAEVSVVTGACSALARLGATAEGCGAIIDAEGMRPTLAVLARHAGDVDAVSSACGVLSALCGSAAGRLSFVSAGGASAVVAALETHGADVSTVTNVCKVLLKVGDSADTNAAVVDAGGLLAIAGTLRRHVSQESIVDAACMVLVALVGKGTNHVAITAAGCIGAFVDAMTAQATSLRVVQHACQALCLLAADTGARAAVAESGGIDAVICGLRHHMSDVAAATLACSAMRHFAFHVETAAAAAAGIPDIVAALAAHCSSNFVAEAACLALAAFLRTEEQLSKLAARGGSSAAVEAPALQTASASERIVAVGGLSPVAAAFSTHVGSVEVVRSAFGVLIGLAHDTSRHDALASAGIISTAINAASMHCTCKGTVFALCRLLYYLGGREDVRRAVVDAGGLAKVAAAVAALEQPPVSLAWKEALVSLGHAAA